jgi:hypothetical protein
MMKAAIYSETLVALDAVEKKRSCWFCGESNPDLLILHTASPSTYRIKCSDRLRKVSYHGVSMKGLVKAGSVQYSLPGAEDKTQTHNLRIKIGRMNTEPTKSVRRKSPPAFTMYKITHVSLNCGPQA